MSQAPRMAVEFDRVSIVFGDKPERALPLADEGLDGHPVAVLLCEQYYDFAEELADQYLVMERGEIIARGPGSEMAARGIRRLVAI